MDRRTLWGTVGALGTPLGAVVSALIVNGIIIHLSGQSPTAAFEALLDGAFGSRYSLSETLLKTCPLLFTGLAVALAFRCGVWNIGAEGQLYMGALSAAWIGTSISSTPGFILLPLILLVSFISGGLWAGIAAILKIKRGVQEVISTIMLNFVAIQIASWAVHGPLMEKAGKFPQSDAVYEAARLSRIAPPTRLHAGVILALVLACFAYFLLYKTVLGYRIRSVGLNPQAARYAGIKVEQNILLTMLISGGLAGIAGAVELVGLTYRLYEKFSPGYGYTAIAVALLGRLNPIGVIFSSFLFGAMNAGAGNMQRAAGVSSVMVYVIQATIIFFVVGYEGWRKGAYRRTFWEKMGRKRTNQ